jgi:hypothetical protein
VSVSVSPKRLDTMRRVVSVWTRWGDYVLSVRDVRRGESLDVGSPPRRLLSFQQASPRIWPGPLDEQQAGRALDPGETITVCRGELDYTITSSDGEMPEFAPSGRKWAALDALALAAFVAAWGWHSAPRLAVAIAPLPGVGAAARPTHLESSEDAPARQAIFAVVTEPEPMLFELSGESRCGRVEPGDRIAENRVGRYGMVGPIDNADPHLARPVPDQGHPTARGAQATIGRPQMQPGSAGPTPPWGRADSLGTDAANARGRMWDESIVDVAGDEGLGVAGYIGGVTKTFDVGALGDEPNAQPRVLHTGLRVSGARKASEVGRVMAAHFDDFRACAGGMQPAQQLSVRLAFDVTVDGRASVTDASVNAVEQCLARSMSGVSFVAGAGSAAHVVYPLHFVAARTSLQSPRAASLPPQACDCGG